MIWYVYEDHLYGEYYVVDDDDWGTYICPQCGDSDRLIYAGTIEEILNECLTVSDAEYAYVKELLQKISEVEE